jgi:hypothetical protein
MTPRFHRLSVAALLVVFAGLLAGCGGGGYVYEEVYYEPIYEQPVYEEPVYLASIDLDNLSPEYIATFFLAPAATDLWSEELLGWPLAPADTAYIGDFPEDWYDAEADMELGDLVTWFDVFAPGGELTIFEVW